ncbi:Hypothetical predicted protein [Podarcis lilfordi]|uniref:Uncharacterized protein n=1 Tax=Podarcis lilfordi TaxID=74358 RepID=A0AA35K7H3_9SAUR|nr:Hypothetical predicted protein [Podarcis lilfordi]
MASNKAISDSSRRMANVTERRKSIEKYFKSTKQNVLEVPTRMYLDRRLPENPADAALNFIEGHYQTRVFLEEACQDWILEKENLVTVIQKRVLPALCASTWTANIIMSLGARSKREACATTSNYPSLFGCGHPSHFIQQRSSEQGPRRFKGLMTDLD